VFALAWWSLLQSYRQLSQARFEVINEIETQLPVHVFSDEWRSLTAMRRPARAWPPRQLLAWLRGYHDLGTSERIVPLAFVAIYIAELIRQATS